MEQQPQINEEEVINSIVQKWIEHSTAHPEITAGTWLRSFAIMAGMTLGIAGAEDDQAQLALQDVVNIAANAYFNTMQEIPPATLQ